MIQFDDPKRGFSYRFNGPLDMRMDQRQTLTAFKVINSYDAVHLKKIFKVLYIVTAREFP